MGWCTAQCKITQTIMKESCNFEIACPKKKKNKERKTFWPSGDFLVRYFRDAVSHY